MTVSGKQRFGLVLSGGGARGAYEAGVMRYLACNLAPKIGGLPFQIACGTSIGAAQVAWLAGHGFTSASARRLSAIWQTLTTDQVFHFEAMDLLRSPAQLFRRSGQRAGGSLVDPRPMHRLIRSLFPEKGLRRRLASGALRALSISTTQVSDGLSVRFVDHSEQEWRSYHSPPTIAVRRARITAEHVLASAAIPFIFPPVAVDGGYHVDGSLRQNTPLTPALRLGSERILVIGCKAPFTPSPPPEGSEASPNLFYLLGKALDALMLDPVAQDLDRVEAMNTFLDWGTRSYGGDFIDRLNADLAPRAGHPYRLVRTRLIHPSEDLGRVAAAAFRTGEASLNRATRLLLSTVAAREGEEDADLLSYLLFDRCYTAELERLGWEDARDKEEDLAGFLTGTRA